MMPQDLDTDTKDIPPCPECLQGKHGNCDGDSWDPTYDEPTLCPCFAASHVEDEEQ